MTNKVVMEIGLFGFDCVVLLWPLLHGTEMALFGIGFIVLFWPLPQDTGTNHLAHALESINRYLWLCVATLVLASRVWKWRFWDSTVLHHS